MNMRRRENNSLSNLNFDYTNASSFQDNKLSLGNDMLHTVLQFSELKFLVKNPI